MEIHEDWIEAHRYLEMQALREQSKAKSVRWRHEGKQYKERLSTGLRAPVTLRLGGEHWGATAPQQKTGPIKPTNKIPNSYQPLPFC